MYFIDYSTLEEKIFNNVRKYFEKLPTIACDDYDNAFSDVITQYGWGGEDCLRYGYMTIIQSMIFQTLMKMRRIKLKIEF